MQPLKTYLISTVIAVIVTGITFYFLSLMVETDIQPIGAGENSTIKVVDEVVLPTTRRVIRDCGIGGVVIVRNDAQLPIPGAEIQLEITYEKPDKADYVRVLKSETALDGVSHVFGLGSCGSGKFTVLKISSSGYITSEIPSSSFWRLPQIIVLEKDEST